MRTFVFAMILAIASASLARANPPTTQPARDELAVLSAEVARLRSEYNRLAERLSKLSDEVKLLEQAMTKPAQRPAAEAAPKNVEARPDEILQAIREKRVVKGMTLDEVIQVVGGPPTRSRADIHVWDQVEGIGLSTVNPAHLGLAAQDPILYKLSISMNQGKVATVGLDNIRKKPAPPKP